MTDPLLSATTVTRWGARTALLVLWLLPAAPFLPTPALSEKAVQAVDAGTNDDETGAPTDAVTLGDLTLTKAWTRQTPPNARAGGGYITITNQGAEPDRLVGGSVSFAERLELHRMNVEDGVMRMGKLDEGIAIEPGETVRLEPGGLHLMFIGMTEPPVEGSTVSVTLGFERAGEVTISMPVAAIGARSP